MEPFTVGLLLYAAYRGAKVLFGTTNETSTGVGTPTPPAPCPTVPPERKITFVGATGVGKSSTANALLGREVFRADADHHTTRAVAQAEYRNGYLLEDTPGLLDETDYTAPIWSAVQKSELVIFVSKGQLLRPELEFFREIAARQEGWNRQAPSSARPRQLALFVNMLDVKKATMCSAHREAEMLALGHQVSSILRPDLIVSGAASPRDSEGSPRETNINDLRCLIHRVIEG